MRDHPSKPRRRGLRVAFGALALTCAAFACALLFPSQAQAWGSRCYVQDSSGNKTYYDDHQEAINNACEEGKVVVLTRSDRYISTKAALSIPEGKSVTINMNGCGLLNCYGSMFLLNKNSTLTLLSCDPDGKADAEGKRYNAGAVYGCDPEKGGIYLTEGSHLTLDNIEVKENRSGSSGAGGIYVEKSNCTIDLRNNSNIKGNSTMGDGGGIYIDGENAHVTLDNSAITGNKAEGSGGGIYINAKGAVIDLQNGSTIDGNEADDGGGGIYCNVSFFTIKSSDGTGAIYGNKAKGSSRAGTKGGQSGGGIHVDAKSGENEGLIEGLLISNNYSAYDGGGLELDQRWTTVRNCTITGNTCKYEGGGAYVCNNNVLFDNCEVTGNACNVDSGGNYEGGGVYVWCDYDLKLAGTCVISGNTRGKDGSADDVFLRENAGATAKAYVTGYLAKGSRVGVRTGIEGDRRIAKSFRSETNDALFIDLSGYYVSYGSDDGGDAWQRHRELSFAAKVNGEVKARYKQGAQALLTAAATKGDDQVFWHWDAESTTGLYPVESYITADNCLGAALAFDMPQHDVDAAAVYATRAKKVLVAVEAPVAGKALPQTAQVVRVDAGVGGNYEFKAPVTWYEVGEGGKRTAAAGKAKGGTTYVASVTCVEAPQYGLYFAKSLAAADVTVKTASGEAPAASAKVDAATGALTVETAAFAKTAGQAPAKSATVKVSAKKKSVKKAVAETGGTQAAAVASLASLGDEAALADEGPQADDDSLGGFEVSYAEGSGDVTVVAPAKAGYNFCNWEDVPDGWEPDDEAGTVTIPESALADAEGLDVTAVYTPVVTEVEVEMDEPAPAAGERLATAARSIVLKASDGEEVDLVGAVGKGQCAVTWAPGAEGGIAGYSTAYTALVEVTDAEGLSGVENVLATGASVKVTAANGASALGADAAAFTVIDGKLYLVISFPATKDLAVKSVSQPGAVEVSFADAQAYQAEGSWPLPRTVSVELENGETADADVEWESVEGFDAAATGAQELQVKGRISNIAYEDADIDAESYDAEVTVTVKVAAPEDPASGEDDKKGDEDEKNDDESKTDEDEEKTETTTVTETKSAAKKGTPSTGDVTYGGLAGLLALAVACLAAARLSRRKN